MQWRIFKANHKWGGALRVGSRRQDGGGSFSTVGKYAIPIFRGLKEKVGNAAKGVAEAVKTAGGKSIKKLVREAPKVGVKRALQKGSDKFREKFTGSASGIVSSALGDIGGDDDEDEPKPQKAGGRKKHKRSKIDQVLGDDSY